LSVCRGGPRRPAGGAPEPKALHMKRFSRPFTCVLLWQHFPRPCAPRRSPFPRLSLLSLSLSLERLSGLGSALCVMASAPPVTGADAAASRSLSCRRARTCSCTAPPRSSPSPMPRRASRGARPAAVRAPPARAAASAAAAARRRRRRPSRRRGCAGAAWRCCLRAAPFPRYYRARWLPLRLAALEMVARARARAAPPPPRRILCPGAGGARASHAARDVVDRVVPTTMPAPTPTPPTPTPTPPTPTLAKKKEAGLQSQPDFRCLAAGEPAPDSSAGPQTYRSPRSRNTQKCVCVCVCARVCVCVCVFVCSKRQSGG
jgi:hypothetical protein